MQTPSFFEIEFQFSAKTFDPLYVNENLNFTFMQHYIVKRKRYYHQNFWWITHFFYIGLDKNFNLQTFFTSQKYFFSEVNYFAQGFLQREKLEFSEFLPENPDEEDPEGVFRLLLFVQHSDFFFMSWHSQKASSSSCALIFKRILLWEWNISIPSLSWIFKSRYVIWGRINPFSSIGNLSTLGGIIWQLVIVGNSWFPCKSKMVNFFVKSQVKFPCLKTTKIGWDPFSQMVGGLTSSISKSYLDLSKITLDNWSKRQSLIFAWKTLNPKQTFAGSTSVAAAIPKIN